MDIYQSLLDKEMPDFEIIEILDANGKNLKTTNGYQISTIKLPFSSSNLSDLSSHLKKCLFFHQHMLWLFILHTYIFLMMLLNTNSYLFYKQNESIQLVKM